MNEQGGASDEFDQKSAKLADGEPTCDPSCGEDEASGDRKKESSGAEEEGGAPAIKKLFTVGPDGVPAPLPVEGLESDGEESSQKR